MPRFVTIGYGDQAGYDRTAPEVRAAAHRADQQLKNDRAIIGIAGEPVRVRNPNGEGIQTQKSAFMFSPLPIAGFAIIEAKDIEEAIEIVAQTPCAVAQGVVEVWPLLES